MNFIDEGTAVDTLPRFRILREHISYCFEHALDIYDFLRPVFRLGIAYGVCIPPFDTNLWTTDIVWNRSLVIFLTLLGISKMANDPSGRL